MTGSARRAFLAGVLVANSAPHLGSFVAGRRHLSPLGGRAAGPTANLVWGLANAVCGYLLLRGAPPPNDTQRWDSTLLAFEAGAATWSLWSVSSETVLRTSSN